MEARPDSVTENKTVEHMERIFQTAKQTGFEVFISPHYYFPTDDRWQFRDPLGSVMHENHLFARAGALRLEGFSGSGADWLARFKPYIEDGKTIVVSPHKIPSATFALLGGLTPRCRSLRADGETRAIDRVCGEGPALKSQTKGKVKMKTLLI